MRIAIVLLSAALFPFALHADGGVVCLHETSGAFLVTVFVSPSPIRAGPIDTTVLVQGANSGEVILDAAIQLAVHPFTAQTPGAPTQATHAQATNKLLSAARIELPAAGLWVLDVYVSRGNEKAALTTKLQVAPATPRVAAIWPFLLFPPLAIVLFVVHQALIRSKPPAVLSA